MIQNERRVEKTDRHFVEVRAGCDAREEDGEVSQLPPLAQRQHRLIRQDVPNARQPVYYFE